MSIVDLFAWRDEAEAAQAVAVAEDVRAEAERARRFAPHGQVRIRQERLEAATRAALQAAQRLAEIQRAAVKP